MVANKSLLVPSIFSNYWMRMWSRMWRIMQIEEDVIHHGERPRTPFFFSSPGNEQLGCRSGKRGWSMQYHRPLYIQPQIPEISLGTSKWERTISVWSDRNIRGCPLWPVWSFRSVRPKCPFPFDKIVVPSTALLKNNNQTRGGLGPVCATGMYCSIGHVKFPKFQTGIFVKWKAPIIYTNESMIHCSHLPNMVSASWLWKISRGIGNN